MKRSIVLATFVVAAVLAIGGAFAINLSDRGTSAQDAATEGHPIVGVWLVDVDLEVETNPLNVFTFNADGAFTNVEVEGVDGFVSTGAWEATGATTANLTIVAPEGDEEGASAGVVTIRASFEVSADGNTFTAQYTYEFTEPDGSSVGEVGPGPVTGTRLVVEGPGTPVMSFDEFFGGVEGTPEAAPAATPTA